jgi:hypothetical protein
MKKILAILTVLILTAGMMFADPSQATGATCIAIKASLGEVIPAFQLLYRTNATNPDGKTFGTESSYTLPQAFSTGLDLSKEDVTAEFYAVIARGARQTADYLLTFEAGAFDTKSNKVNKPTACSDSTLVESIEQQYADSVSASDISSATGSNSQSAKISLNGNVIVAEQVRLLRFVATWTKDTTIDAGTYSADVTMTVSSL